MYEPLDTYLDLVDAQDAERDAWALQCEITRLMQSAGVTAALDVIEAIVSQAIDREYTALQELPY